MPTQRSTEERVSDLETHFRVTDVKLDALIDSVKEVNEVVKKLAEIANAHALTNLQVLQLQKEINDLSNETVSELSTLESRVDERVKKLEVRIDERERKTDPIIERGKTYMNYVKVWAFIGTVAIAMAQTYGIWLISGIADHSKTMYDKVISLEHATKNHKEYIDDLKREIRKGS